MKVEMNDLERETLRMALDRVILILDEFRDTVVRHSEYLYGSRTADEAVITRIEVARRRADNIDSMVLGDQTTYLDPEPFRYDHGMREFDDRDSEAIEFDERTPEERLAYLREDRQALIEERWRTETEAMEAAWEEKTEVTNR